MLYRTGEYRLTSDSLFKGLKIICSFNLHEAYRTHEKEHAQLMKHYYIECFKQNDPVKWIEKAKFVNLHRRKTWFKD